MVVIHWTNCLFSLSGHWLTHQCYSHTCRCSRTGVHTLPNSENTIVRALSLNTPGEGVAYFHTLMTPSLDPVMTIHWEAWHRLMSLMMSRCPWGGASGPLRGASSLVTGFFVYSSWITSTPSTSLALPMTIKPNRSQISWQ